MTLEALYLTVLRLNTLQRFKEGLPIKLWIENLF